MTRFRVPFLVALVAVGMTLPVHAARPQFANRGGAAGVALHSAPVRRPASTLPRPVSSVTRAPTTPIRVPAPLTKRPAVGIAGRTNGGPNSPFPGAGRLPIDPTREEVSLPRPGNPSRRPISVERPDLDVSYRPGPEIRNPNGNNGGGGGNNGGGNGGGRHPHPGRRPCHGPTGWDLVAIGLATAALVDGGVGQGVCYAGDSVIVGQPTCCVGTPVVESQAVIEDNATTEAVLPTAPTLPQLRVGEPFQLPAQGLGVEQGRAAVKVGAAIHDCPVTAWCDAGFDAMLPEIALTGPVAAELIVAFADGTLAAALPVELLPATARQ